MVRRDSLLGAALLDEPFGQAGVLRLGDHPAHHVAAEDVDDYVEVEVDQLRRALELGDVPGPDLLGSRGYELGPGVARVPELVAPLARLAAVGQEQIHRPRRAQVAALLYRRRVVLTRYIWLSAV